jgi:periplasmic divalent cation tolerance protein
MGEYMMVYITTPDTACAEEIGRTLVEEGLAACANLIPGMTSIYRWEGNVQRGEEVVLLVKTRATHFDAVRRRVREMHPYTCPCVTGWPIAFIDADFAKWIGEQTTR